MSDHLQEKPLSPSVSSGRQWLLEIAPLVAFFAGYHQLGLIPATAIFVVISTICLLWHYFLTRTWSPPLLLSTVLVALFGGLTLATNDPFFIKIRPTLVNSMFALTLLVGALVFRRGLLRYLLNRAFALTDEGWRVLSLRWAGFFAFLAAMNELVWRTQPTETWVHYKIFGVMGLTLLFTLSQIRAMQRYRAQ